MYELNEHLLNIEDTYLSKMTTILFINNVRHTNNFLINITNPQINCILTNVEQIKLIS